MRYDDYWISTQNQHRFHFLNPIPDEVFIEDIAHSLALTCRFGGHGSRFYSVAEHSIRMAREINDDPLTRLAALLHDAEEAYIPDIPRPIKPKLKVEHLYAPIRWAINDKFGLSGENVDWKRVKKLDNQICIAEAKALGLWDIDWFSDDSGVFDKVPPICFGWMWREAEVEFLKEFGKITGVYSVVQ